MIEFLLITLIPVLSIVLLKKHRDWYNYYLRRVSEEETIRKGLPASSGKPRKQELKQVRFSL